MNRTDRLLAIVLELQRKGKQRAEDLAETFETSKRTIYRDIQALSEAGVPILATPGNGYALMEGYFLPPVQFTAEEATTMLLGSDYVGSHFDLPYQESADAARQKIEAILPLKLRHSVQHLRDRLHFLSLDSSYHETERQSPEKIKLGMVRRAILEEKEIRFSYRKHCGSESNASCSERTVQPYGLVHVLGSWHLIAHCLLRGAIRQFRLDRMDSLEVLPTTFLRPADFRIQDYEPDQNFGLLVTVLISKEAAPLVKERRSFYLTEEREVAEGHLLSLRVRREEDILAWILSWGSHAQVLSPGSLAEKIRREAEKTLSRYRESEGLAEKQ